MPRVTPGERIAKLKADAPGAQDAAAEIAAAIDAADWPKVADLAKRLEAFGCYARRTAATLREDS